MFDLRAPLVPLPVFFSRSTRCSKLALRISISALLLLSSDILPNPGPVKFPCGICHRPVKSNQKGIPCDCCSYWPHTRCIGMSDDEYHALSLSDDPWCCATCLSEALSFMTAQPSILLPSLMIVLHHLFCFTCLFLLSKFLFFYFLL